MQAGQNNDLGNSPAAYICYLDFDGVLHRESILIKRGRRVFMAMPGCHLFEWEDILREMIEPHPDVKIVLSTSWIRSRSLTYARQCLHPAIQTRVIGATFHRRWMHPEEFSALPRGIQILGDVLRRNPLDWFAIDQDEFGWPVWCREKLILTQEALGLSEIAVQASVRSRLASWAL